MKSPVIRSLTRSATRSLALLALSSALVAYAGCSTDEAVHEAPPVADGGAADTGMSMTDGGTNDGSIVPDDCFMNPTTHFEIINACTDAARVDKKPPLPLLLADGGLPPPP